MREASIEEVRRLPAIASGYRSDRVLRLERLEDERGLTWSLREEILAKPFVKQYDDGNVDDLIELYQESVAPGAIRLLVAGDARPSGLLLWAQVSWNDTAWLIDVRVREGDRRRGVGSALVQALIDQARRAHVRAVTVETQSTNYPAVQFYRSRGFRVVGLHEALYSNNDAEHQDVAIFLSRPL